MMMTLTLAAALALSPPAHAITDGQADAIIYAEAVAALESLVAQSTKSAAAGERALKVGARDASLYLRQTWTQSAFWTPRL